MAGSIAKNDPTAFRKQISPERDFTIITLGVPPDGGPASGQENLSDEYSKTKADVNPTGGPKDVEQVPVVLAVKGPVSLRRAGNWYGPGFWMADSYRVTVGKKIVT